jgi:hypothetical protein
LLRAIRPACPNPRGMTNASERKYHGEKEKAKRDIAVSNL